jgi:hypothetical protein
MGYDKRKLITEGGCLHDPGVGYIGDVDLLFFRWLHGEYEFDPHNKECSFIVMIRLGMGNDHHRNSTINAAIDSTISRVRGCLSLG